MLIEYLTCKECLVWCILLTNIQACSFLHNRQKKNCYTLIALYRPGKKTSSSLKEKRGLVGFEPELTSIKVALQRKQEIAYSSNN